MNDDEPWAKSVTFPAVTNPHLPFITIAISTENLTPPPEVAETQYTVEVPPFVDAWQVDSFRSIQTTRACLFKKYVRDPSG